MEAQVTIAELKAKAKKIQADADLNKKTRIQNEYLTHEEEISELEIKRTKKLADIES